VGLVLLHGFLDRFEDSHCSAMVAFLLELGRILGKAARTFTGSEASWRAALRGSYWWMLEAYSSACALWKFEDMPAGV